MDYNTSITESQERKPKHCGLDVREEGRHEEVQKGSQGAADWTLEWREGSRKSKKTETSKFLLTYKHSRYIICNIVTYKLSRN